MCLSHRPRGPRQQLRLIPLAPPSSQQQQAQRKPVGSEQHHPRSDSGPGDLDLPSHLPRAAEAELPILERQYHSQFKARPPHSRQERPHAQQPRRDPRPPRLEQEDPRSQGGEEGLPEPRTLQERSVFPADERAQPLQPQPQPQRQFLEPVITPEAKAKVKARRTRRWQKPGLTANRNERIFVKHNYHDHADEVDSESEEDGGNIDARANARRRAVETTFPLKLHNMLDAAARTNHTADDVDHIVSWAPHGRAFVIHKRQEFAEEVMPRYFNQTKITSFQRQLNLYGFQRVTLGPDNGAYYHELFLRGKPFLVRKMKRVRVKGTRYKAASSPDSEPDFYGMPFLPAARCGRAACGGGAEVGKRSEASASLSVSSQQQRLLLPPASPVRRADDSIRKLLDEDIRGTASPKIDTLQSQAASATPESGLCRGRSSSITVASVSASSSGDSSTKASDRRNEAPVTPEDFRPPPPAVVAVPATHHSTDSAAAAEVAPSPVLAPGVFFGCDSPKPKAAPLVRGVGEGKPIQGPTSPTNGRLWLPPPPVALGNPRTYRSARAPAPVNAWRTTVPPPPFYNLFEFNDPEASRASRHRVLGPSSSGFAPPPNRTPPSTDCSLRLPSGEKLSGSFCFPNLEKSQQQVQAHRQQHDQSLPRGQRLSSRQWPDKSPFVRSLEDLMTPPRAAQRTRVRPPAPPVVSESASSSSTSSGSERSSSASPPARADDSMEGIGEGRGGERDFEDDDYDMDRIFEPVAGEEELESLRGAGEKQNRGPQAIAEPLPLKSDKHGGTGKTTDSLLLGFAHDWALLAPDDDEEVMGDISGDGDDDDIMADLDFVSSQRIQDDAELCRLIEQLAEK